MNLQCTIGDLMIEWLSDSRETNPRVFQLLSDMYVDYCKEIRQYSDKVQVEPLLPPEENRSVNYMLIWKQDPEKLALAGFILYCLPPDGFANNDMYIGELYIAPEYRHQGLATDAVRMMIRTTGSQDLDISMFILDGNRPAQRFWEKYCRNHGYTDRFLDGHVKAVSMENEDLQMFYWRKTPKNA